MVQCCVAKLGGVTVFQCLVSIYLAMSGSSGPVLCSLARWGSSVSVVGVYIFSYVR